MQLYTQQFDGVFKLSLYVFQLSIFGVHVIYFWRVQSYSFGNLYPHVKFQNSSTIHSEKKVTTAERKRGTKEK